MLGSLLSLRRDYLGTVARAAREVGGLVRVSAGPPGWRMTFHVVSSPELAGEVLRHPDRFRKDAPGYRELRSALGDSMLTSQDEVWRRQRRLLAPAFTHRRIVSDYAVVMVEEAEQLVQRWRQAARRGQVLNAYAEMVRVTAQVVGRVLFGADVSRAVGQLARFRLINDALLRRVVSPHPVPRSWPTPANRRLDTELAAVRHVVDTIIVERRSRGHTNGEDGGPRDLLGLLLRERDSPEADQPLSDEEVADQVLVFLLAGLETTAVTLACTLVQLALAPRWQDVLRAELDGVGDLAAAADTGTLVWTGRVLRESMRLFPAAHGMARQCRRSEVLAGHRVPAGSWLEVSPWAIHHSPAVWADASAFDPGRFDVPAARPAGVHRHAWLPFGAGPHVCVGMHLAMLELQIVLGAVVRDFSWRTPLTSVPVHAAITLQPTGDLPLELRTRDSRTSVR